MEKRIFYFYFLPIVGGFLLLGLLICMGMSGGSHYYQTSEYNNLPPLTTATTTATAPEDTKPAPIQHYEDMRDKLTVPEDNVTVPANITVGQYLNNTGLGMNIFISPFRSDGGINLYFIAFVAALTFMLHSGAFPFYFGTRRRWLASFLVALGLVLFVYYALGILSPA